MCTALRRAGLLLSCFCLLTLTPRAQTNPPANRVRAVLQPVKDRKPAPEFELKDATGRTVRLSDYRGKAVLLDFWATWCTGCKEEIPGFSELATRYHAKGLSVVGVAMDDDGWKVITPFLADTKVSYPILAGDQGTFDSLGLKLLPDTLLIDRQGRIAAIYMGVVNQADVEANVKAVLSIH
jgi:peroxiredoxin